MGKMSRKLVKMDSSTVSYDGALKWYLCFFYLSFMVPWNDISVFLFEFLEITELGYTNLVGHTNLYLQRNSSDDVLCCRMLVFAEARTGILWKSFYAIVV